MPLLDDHASDGLRGVVDLAVDAPREALQDGPVHLQHVGDVPGVLPVALDDRAAHVGAGVDQMLDGVGDLQLAAPGRCDGADRVVDQRGEEIDADQGEVALGVLGFLLQADDLARVVEFGDAEGARVLDAGEQDLGVGAVGAEPVDEAGDSADDEVVAEVHHEVVVAQVVTGDEHGVGQSQGPFLGNVGDLQTELGTVADGVLDLRGGVTDDHTDLGDPGRGDGFQPVEEHGLVRHRHELFGRSVRYRPQARTGATGQHESLHRFTLAPIRPI